MYRLLASTACSETSLQVLKVCYTAFHCTYVLLHFSYVSMQLTSIIVYMQQVAQPAQEDVHLLLQVGSPGLAHPGLQAGLQARQALIPNPP